MKNKCPDHIEQAKSLALAELAGMDAAVDVLAVLSTRLMEIPDRIAKAIPDGIVLPEVARGALIAEIHDALAFVTFNLEKLVLDLQDRLEQETNGQGR